MKSTSFAPIVGARPARRPLLVALTVLGASALGCASPLFGPDGMFDLDGDGYANAVDCDDFDATVHPDAGERCDGAGRDEDCDHKIDDEDDDVQDPATWYRDADDDGFGKELEESNVFACAAPRGYVAEGHDCDDTDEKVNPGASEVCDAAVTDEDCNGKADDDDDGAEGKVSTFVDRDGDGYGAPGDHETACHPEHGWADNDDDCDDDDDAIHPGAVEVCDDEDVDEDCDGGADDADPEADATGTQRRFPDADDDGYGWGATEWACDLAEHTAWVYGDCDESDPAINPGAAEICNDGIDQDCDGTGSACMTLGDATDVSAGARIHADNNTTNLAWRIAVADTDDDGRMEAWLSDPDQEYGLNFGGAIAVTGRLSGDGTAGDFDLDEVRAEKAWLVGLAIASGGDLTGDGVDDLVLGSSYATSTAAYSGGVWILAGPIAPGTTEKDAFAVRGGAAYLGVGGEVAVGDYDGDGHPDLFLQQASGTLYGELGPVTAGTANANLVASVEASISTEVRLALGDLDGDGAAELVSGAPNSGAVVVYPGGLLGGLVASDRLYTFTHSTGGDAGAALVVGEDLNGDGYGDLVIGAPLAETGGEVYEFNGPLSGTGDEGDADTYLTTSAAYGGLGTSLASGGDLDGDGSVDLAIGAHFADSGAGYVKLFSGFIPGTYPWATLSGRDADVELGDSLAIADLDGDGLPDLIAGARGWEKAYDGGAAIWYSGRD